MNPFSSGQDQPPATALSDLPLFAERRRPPLDVSSIDPHRVAIDRTSPTSQPISLAPPAKPEPAAYPTTPLAQSTTLDTQLMPPPDNPPITHSHRSATGLTLTSSVTPPVIPLTETPAVTWSGEQPLDWSLVAQLRQAASDRLSHRIGSDRVSIDQQHQFGRLIVSDLLDEQASQTLARGNTPWSPGYQARIGQAVYDALFRLGRLQPLVDDDTIENIIICGADQVWLENIDGALVPGPPVAESDQELIDFLCFIAARSEVNERSFSPANPRLHLRLDSGARLAAAAWVTPRPSVVIRRHRLQQVTLDDLVERQTMRPDAAAFLRAAVQRRASIVVSGAQGAGKTTLMRALCSAIHRNEVIGTFETEYELGLHLMPERHRVVYAWEARPGSGETDAAGRRVGEFLLDDALYDSFRFNLSRQIVGEVRGREILAMIKAMQSGSGSLSTTHANSAEGAIRKLITCAMEAGPHVTATYATRAIAESIDFIVHMDMRTAIFADKGKRRHRWISEILAVEPSDSARGYSTTRIFSTLPGDGIAALEVMPEGYADVFDPMEEAWKLSWP